ncbi:hypothetical protein F2P81_015707 [Scophthalmus maximus]|uniref:Uncharacterized protein n=1 Tax=Scophthalmus maximus TaxID=52904 RepID=A0A6A4SLF6_SCOMX|nr:hypothetical protein F2P81_015707 [Scophthalmus maximus]
MRRSRKNGTLMLRGLLLLRGVGLRPARSAPTSRGRTLQNHQTDEKLLSQSHCDTVLYQWTLFPHCALMTASGCESGSGFQLVLIESLNAKGPFITKEIIKMKTEKHVNNETAAGQSNSKLRFDFGERTTLKKITLGREESQESRSIKENLFGCLFPRDANRFAKTFLTLFNKTTKNLPGSLETESTCRVECFPTMLQEIHIEMKSSQQRNRYPLLVDLCSSGLRWRIRHRAARLLRVRENSRVDESPSRGAAAEIIIHYK